MSSSTSTVTFAQFVQELTNATFENKVTNYFTYAALTILVWDSLLTLDREVESIWERKFTLGTYLYLFSRYGSIANLFITCFGPLILSEQIQVVAIPATILSTHAFFGLFTARAYAISGRRKLVLFILLPIDLIRFANNIVGITVLIANCHHDNILPPVLARREVIVSDINVAMSISTQTLCFLITLYHTYGTWRTFRRITSPSDMKHVTVVILEQGFYQFGLMIIIVIIVNVATYTLDPNVRVFLDTSALGVAVPTVVFGRFCLDLRDRNTPSIQSVESRVSPGISWASSEARLIAEFGERSLSSPTTPRSRSTFSSNRRVSEADDIAMVAYKPVATDAESDRSVPAETPTP